MNALDAPYNFVPLSEHVQLPDWSSEVSLDIPFSDGLNGVLEIAIEALSPLCIGDKHRKANDREPGRVRFYRLPDGTPAIPGSSLRGMIRNVMEIACFGRMSLIDDRRFGLRDLTGAAKEDYTGRITTTLEHKRLPLYKPNSKAGWLVFSRADRAWQIKPCRFARVEHSMLENIAGIGRNELHGKRNRRGCYDGIPAEGKYAKWPTTVSLEQNFAIEAIKPHQHTRTTNGRTETYFLEYSRAFEVGAALTGVATKTERGTIVLTGQPGRLESAHSKHMEFVFFDTNGAISVESEVMRAFLDIHEDAEKPSPTWLYWRGKHFGSQGGEPIPIFYLEEGGKITALGLAMMFKLAGKYSTHQLRGNVQPPVVTDDKTPPPLDLVEAVFGRVGDKPEHALRGRVAFGTAPLCNPTQVELRMEQPTILGSPKPSYFPTYLRQPLGDARGTRLPNNDNYRTYMDGKAELAGWKRYPVHPPDDVRLPELNDSNRDARQVQIRLETLVGRDRKRPRFVSRLHFHNLRPVELGAVLWALRFGERDDLRHAIGMGKPHGFGQITIRIGGDGMATSLRRNDGQEITTQRCLDAFIERMECWAKEHERAASFLGGWSGSVQVQRLLEMADPDQVAQWPGQLKQMKLGLGRNQNEFVLAKRPNRFVLAPYGDIALEEQRPPIAPKLSASSPPPAGGGAASGGASGTTLPAPGAQHRAGTRARYQGRRCRLVTAVQPGMTTVTIRFENGAVEQAPVADLAFNR